MSKFIALPVGQGDAFYLERDDFRVLVDGGKSKSAISPWMKDICKTGHLDVLVCTHNDIDHANGVVGLLENWSGSIREVWLPGSWTYRMKDLFEKPHDFCQELVNDIVRIEDREELGAITLESIGQGKEFLCSELEYSSKFVLNDIIDIAEDFPTSLFGICLGCPDFERLWFHCIHRIHRVRPLPFLFIEAINAAKNIRQIAELAYHRGCKISFFEYENSVSGELPQKLVPINSKEIVSLRSVEIRALKFLALTTQNRESLVFYSPEDENNPAVLFSADSDLKCTMPGGPARCPIVTSPHHGADANSNAYSEISKWLKNEVFPIWVRSDCKSRTRPGKDYKNQSHKVCTLCNCGTYPKQTVKLHSRKGRWRITKGTKGCSCT